MILKKHLISSFLLTQLLLCILFVQNTVNTSTHANEIPIDLDSHGGIIPNNNTSLMMPAAKVLFEISNITSVTDYHIKFDANYSILNQNETINILVGAPFSFVDFDSVYNIKIHANETEIDFTSVHIEKAEDSPWDAFFKYDYDRDFLVSNVTFYANTTTVLHYAFEYIISMYDYPSSKTDYGGITLEYDVGTAKAWSGNISESVNFTFYGEQPFTYNCHSFNGAPKKNPVISTVDNATSYIWIWENEIMKHDLIVIDFAYHEPKRTEFNLVLIIALSTVFLSLLKKNRWKKLKIKKE